MTAWRQVVVESGHMIDTPDRPTPRFPAEAEGRVAAAIDKTLDEWRVGGQTLVLCQGARGTDILVAEAARRRGAGVRLLLSLPVPEFEEESVRLEGGGWLERFRELLAHCPVVVQTDELGPLPEGENPFARNNQWVLDEAFAIARRDGASVDALVVWNGEEGDGKGGTADFVEQARARGADVRVLDPGAD